MRDAFKSRIDSLCRHVSESRFQSFFVNLTYRCPLACRYCYVQQGSRPDMTYEEAEYLIGRLIRGGAHLITFFGGEPALHVQDIRNLLLRFKEQNIHFGIITSFMVNREELISLMNEFPQFEVTVSYDSPENGQRVYHSGRPITFDGVEWERCLGNINLLKVVNGHEKDLEADLGHYLDLLEKYRMYGDVSDNKTPYADMDYERLEEGYYSYALRVTKDYLGGRLLYLPKHYVKHMMAVLRHNASNMGGCGILKEIFISADGTVSPCSITNAGQELQLDGEEAEERIKDLELSYMDNEACESCTARYFCNGGCLVDRRRTTGSYSQPNPAWCRYIRAVEKAYARVHEDIKAWPPVRQMQLFDAIYKWRTKHYEYCGTKTAFKEIEEDQDVFPFT